MPFLLLFWCLYDVLLYFADVMDSIDLIFNTNLVLHPFLEKHYFVMLYRLLQSFPGGSVVKNLPAVQEKQEMRVWSLGWEDPLEEEMATYSSILAWRILWTEKPGRTPVGHHWTTNMTALDKWSRELWSQGIRRVNSSGQEFLKRFFFSSSNFLRSLQYTVKNHIFPWS